MSLLDLSSYPAIQSNMFVYLNTPNGQFTFSDYHKSFTINGVNYVGLGQLCTIGPTVSNLRSAPQQLAIGIGGIPTSSVDSIIQTKFKGSSITVYRAFFNPSNGSFINVAGNPAGKFVGVVNNYSLDDTLTMGSMDGSFVLTLSCTSNVELLNNKVSGRRTNPVDEALYFPTDKSFNRIPALIRSNFQFGAPTK